MRSLILRACVVAALAWPVVAPVAVRAETTPATEATEALVRAIGEVMEASRTRGALEETMLVGLRSLGDARLTPLFAALSDSGRWEARVHGVLGLAELDATKRVNLLMVSEIVDPQVRAVVISEAIKQDLVDAAGVREMLGIPGLDPTLRLVMLSKLRRLGETVTAEEVEAVVAELSEGQVGVRVYGALVAADMRGEDGAAAWSLLDTVASDAAREAILSVVLQQVREDRLTHVTGFVERARAWAVGRGATELDAVSTMVWQSPDRGLQEWTVLWKAASGLAQRMVLAGQLTGFAPRLAPSAFEPMVADTDPFIRRMGAFGAAVAGGGPVGPEFLALLEGEHRVSTVGALTAMRDIEVSRRVAAHAGVIRGVMERPNRSAVPRYAFESARGLAHDDVGVARERLDAALAAGDARMVEVLLTALLEIDPIVVWEPQAVPEMPDRRTTALAALVVGRSTGGADLTEAQIESLRRIAIGRELLPPAMKVQAAWLALCAAGSEREALARVLAPGAPKPTPTLAD
jgi:hypothetical protein